MTERLKVMCDYGAFPVWGPDGASDPTEVEISDGLRRDLQTWGDEWTNEFYPRTQTEESPPAAWYTDWWRRGLTLLSGSGWKLVLNGKLFTGTPKR